MCNHSCIRQELACYITLVFSTGVYASKQTESRWPTANGIVFVAMLMHVIVRRHIFLSGTDGLQLAHEGGAATGVDAADACVVRCMSPDS